MGKGTVGRRVFRNYYKGFMDKTKGGGWKKRREVGLPEVGGSGEEKMQTTIIEQ